MKRLGPRGRLRAYAYGLVTTATVLVFALAESGTEKFVSDRSRFAGTAIEIAIVLVAALAFRPIHQRIEALIEAAFTKRRREAREALLRLRKELTSFNDPQQILRRVVETVDHHMETAGCAVYLRRDGYAAQASSFDVPADRVEYDDALVVRLRSTAAPADPRALQSPAPGAVAFPMMAGGDLVGFLTLMPERVEYEREDFHALSGLAEAVGLALLPLDPRLRPTGTPRTNLPRMTTSFLGREEEIAEISALLHKHDVVTLVGSGGVGKTRLSLQVAANVLEGFLDGVWLVELAPLASGELIASTVAAAMGRRLASRGEPLENLLGILKSKHAVLVFDNCEHLAQPAAHVIGTILRACRGIKVLASSRQGLEIPGEQTYRLPPLAIPTAISLFADRATAVDRRFVVSEQNESDIAEICRRLDGVPLAIELAASKTAVLSLKQLLEKLNERFRLLAQTSTDRLPRQQTLRAMIDWSFDLLADDERVVFARLSVFSGGWTLEAAQAVCAGGAIDEWRVLELLSALVSKSLVAVETGEDDLRYGLLNSIREYSNERLTAAHEHGDIAAKHAGYYAEFICSLEPLIDSLEDVRWQEAIRKELDNCRGALDWALLRANDPDVGLRVLAHIEWPELVTTPREAVDWFDAAVSLIDATDDPATKARVLRQQVRLKWLVGRPLSERLGAAMQSVAAARASGDPSEIARALTSLGACYTAAGRFADAEPLFQEAYRAPETLSATAVNEVLRNWAVMNLQHGDLEIARRRFTEVVERERPGSEAHASALLNLGELEFEAGNVARARAAARQARATFAQLHAAPLLLVVSNLAAYAMADDDLDEARDLLADALGILKDSGTRWNVTALEHHAVLAALLGDYERGATMLGFTDARSGDGEARQRTEQYGYERLMRLLADRYEEAELTRRLEAGARLKDEQALELAAAIHENFTKTPAASAAE